MLARVLLFIPQHYVTGSLFHFPTLTSCSQMQNKESLSLKIVSRDTTVTEVPKLRCQGQRLQRSKMLSKICVVKYQQIAFRTSPGSLQFLKICKTQTDSVVGIFFLCSSQIKSASLNSNPVRFITWKLKHCKSTQPRLFRSLDRHKVSKFHQMTYEQEMHLHTCSSVYLCSGMFLPQAPVICNRQSSATALRHCLQPENIVAAATSLKRMQFNHNFRSLIPTKLHKNLCSF